jgi:acetoin utilization deacetylase AcuC-like enzyme
MNKTGFLYDERYQLHKTGRFHPEVPDRLPSVFKGIQDAGLFSKLIHIEASQADLKWIELVHDGQYIRRFRSCCSSGKSTFDSPEVAGRVMSGELNNAFCAVRPPGHHAEANKAMGFCYFNNVAIAARYLQNQWGIQRVGIVDFDVHHGNGTQHIFEQDPTVFYYSIHEHPSFAYPGTGREFENGKDLGHGYTKNSPVLPGQGDEEYKRLLERDLLPAFEKFKPEVILVSVGFDAHRDDDMSDMKVSTEGFTWIMQTVVDLAKRYSKGRVISVLEGGYSLKRLPELAANHVRILLNA